ncbi:MAG: TolB family protein [Ignavibacteria bacterium]
MKNFTSIFLLIFSNLSAQIVFTGYDRLNESVKAFYLNLENEQLTELSYANSYLPRWLNENYIVLNIGNSIFKVDKFRQKQNYFFEGFMPVVSRSGKYVAAYSQKGILVADSTGKVLSILEVDYWSKVTPIFSSDEKSIYYYDKKREATFKFDWEKQTNNLFAHNVIHPLTSPDGKRILINFGKMDSNFRVGIVSSDWKENLPINFITSVYENSIVPMWSPSGRYIAYMTLLTNKKLENSDLIPANIILYDTRNGTKQSLTDDAGFTEGAFPQFSFSQDEKYFYYTSIRENGTGTIVQFDLSDFSKKILIADPELDARIPLYCDKIFPQ